VLGLSDVTAADTDTAEPPEPGAGEHDALDPYAVLVPYSSVHSLTSPEFGLTVAFNVAEVAATADAASVTTVGGLGNVVNVWSVPKLVPPAFVVNTRK
jgi:hypothetical protein